MMKSYVMKESQAVCRRWIKTIQEREVTKPILVLPKVENIIEKQSTLTKQLTMCIWLFMFALFMAYQYFKYHCLVCSKSVDAEISIYIWSWFWCIEFPTPCPKWRDREGDQRRTEVYSVHQFMMWIGYCSKEKTQDSAYYQQQQNRSL